ncbi:MAG: winged helix-turn-helix domain-containing protein [Hyphomicrobiales bacterium]
MPIDRELEAGQRRVAVVGFSRNYRSFEVISALVERGFHIIERPCDEHIATILARIAPEVVVLAIRPAEAADLDVVRKIASATDSAIVVLGPGQHHTGFREALEAGADACVSEVFGTGQLVAQVESLVRRVRRRDGPARTEDDVIAIGGLQIDFQRRLIWFNGTRVPMSPIEFKIMALLVKNAGRVLSPEEIAAAVHEYPHSARQARDVKVYVRRLRQKLEAVAPGTRYIFNTRGFGYIFDPNFVSEQMDPDLDISAEARDGHEPPRMWRMG